MLTRRLTLGALAMAALTVSLPVPLAAQTTSPLLLIDQERILRDSLQGRALLNGQERQAEALSAESSSIDRAFEAEERALTEQRDTLPEDAFRKLADAFDEKVVATRRSQERKSVELTRAIETERRAFFLELRPVLIQILQETGASAIVDQRAVLIANQDLNITDEVIRRLDALYTVTDDRSPAPQDEPQKD